MEALAAEIGDVVESGAKANSQGATTHAEQEEVYVVLRGSYNARTDSVRRMMTEDETWGESDDSDDDDDEEGVDGDGD